MDPQASSHNPVGQYAQQQWRYMKLLFVIRHVLPAAFGLLLGLTVLAFLLFA